MRRRGERIEIPSRVSFLTQGNYSDYPDLALLCAYPDSLALSVTAWRGASPSLESTALHAIRGENSYLTLGYLLYCDLARFSDDDWNLALDAAQEDVAANLRVIPQFAKPFCLAVIIGHSGSNSLWADPEDHPWFDPLLRRILECVGARVPTADFSDSYNLLPTSTLDLLSSRRFLEAIPNESIPTILSYFFHNLDSVTRSATAESMLQFWAVFACVARRMQISDYSSYNHVVFLDTCVAALRTWRGSEGMRTGVLNAILLPLQLAPSISQSIWERSWERLGVRDQSVHYVQSVMLELADALAAGLCFSVRASQNPIQTVGWIDGFFLEHLLVDIMSFRGMGDQHDRFVHIIQHCEELRPQWLDGQDMDFASDNPRSAFWSEICKEAAQRGPCPACPESLGYPLSQRRLV